MCLSKQFDLWKCDPPHEKKSETCYHETGSFFPLWYKLNVRLFLKNSLSLTDSGFCYGLVDDRKSVINLTLWPVLFPKSLRTLKDMLMLKWCQRL